MRGFFFFFKTVNGPGRWFISCFHSKVCILILAQHVELQIDAVFTEISQIDRIKEKKKMGPAAASLTELGVASESFQIRSHIIWSSQMNMI